MNIQNMSMMVGGGASVVVILFNLFFTFRNMNDAPFAQGLLPDLIGTLVLMAILLLPALALYMRRNLGSLVKKISVLYPMLVIVAFINLLIASDPLVAGLPFVLVVLPFCIIYGIVVLVKGK